MLYAEEIKPVSLHQVSKFLNQVFLGFHGGDNEWLWTYHLSQSAQRLEARFLVSSLKGSFNVFSKALLSNLRSTFVAFFLILILSISLPHNQTSMLTSNIS